MLKTRKAFNLRAPKINFLLWASSTLIANVMYTSSYSVVTVTLVTTLKTFRICCLINVWRAPRPPIYWLQYNFIQSFFLLFFNLTSKLSSTLFLILRSKKMNGSPWYCMSWWWRDLSSCLLSNLFRASATSERCSNCFRLYAYLCIVIFRKFIVYEIRAIWVVFI